MLKSWSVVVVASESQLFGWCSREGELALIDKVYLKRFIGKLAQIGDPIRTIFRAGMLEMPVLLVNRQKRQQFLAIRESKRRSRVQAPRGYFAKQSARILP
jgi:hypothetical protein